MQLPGGFPRALKLCLRCMVYLQQQPAQLPNALLDRTGPVTPPHAAHVRVINCSSPSGMNWAITHSPHSSHPHLLSILSNCLAIPRAFQVCLNKRFLLPGNSLQLHTDLGIEKVPLFKTPAVAVPSETINSPTEHRGVLNQF